MTWAKKRLSELSWRIDQPREIVDRNVVKPRKRLIMLDRHLPRAAFPPRVLLLPRSKQGGDFGLRFVGILSDVSEPLVKLHNIPSETSRSEGLVLFNKQIISYIIYVVLDFTTQMV